MDYQYDVLAKYGVGDLQISNVEGPSIDFSSTLKQYHGFFNRNWMGPTPAAGAIIRNTGIILEEILWSQGLLTMFQDRVAISYILAILRCAKHTTEAVRG